MKIRPGKMCVDHTIKTAKFISSGTALPKRNATVPTTGIDLYRVVTATVPTTEKALYRVVTVTVPTTETV